MYLLTKHAWGSVFDYSSKKLFKKKLYIYGIETWRDRRFMFAHLPSWLLFTNIQKLLMYFAEHFEGHIHINTYWVLLSGFLGGWVSNSPGIFRGWKDFPIEESYTTEELLTMIILNWHPQQLLSNWGGQGQMLEGPQAIWPTLIRWDEWLQGPECGHQLTNLQIASRKVTVIHIVFTEHTVGMWKLTPLWKYSNGSLGFQKVQEAISLNNFYHLHTSIKH